MTLPRRHACSDRVGRPAPPRVGGPEPGRSRRLVMKAEDMPVFGMFEPVTKRAPTWARLGVTFATGTLSWVVLVTTGALLLR